MRKMKIVVVDSGINIDTEAGKCVKFAYTIKRNPNTMEWEAVLEDSIDTFGHGTAVSNIIYGVNSNVEFISVKLTKKDSFMHLHIFLKIYRPTS